VSSPSSSVLFGPDVARKPYVRAPTAQRSSGRCTVIPSTTLCRELAAFPAFVHVGDIGTPRTIAVTSTDPDC